MKLVTTILDDTVKITEKQYFDAIGWDTLNWVKGLKFVENNVDFKNKKVLELGCGGQNGGLTLWASQLGANDITCTDYGDITASTKNIHADYDLQNVKYGKVDALNIPHTYIHTFDIIMFKSMLGGISRQNTINTELVLQNCAKALKKDGYLFFLENLSSTYIHMFCRQVLKRMTWHYFDICELNNEINKVKEFQVVGHQEYGILACFGRNEKQRAILSKLDNMLEKVCPHNWRYISCWILRKK